MTVVLNVLFAVLCAGLVAATGLTLTYLVWCIRDHHRPATCPFCQHPEEDNCDI